MVLKPIDDEVPDAVQLSPRLGSLRGKVCGIVDDGLSTSHEFLERVSELFEAQYGVRQGVFVRNPSSHSLLPRAVFEEIMAKCDFVVCGVGV